MFGPIPRQGKNIVFALQAPVSHRVHYGVARKGDILPKLQANGNLPRRRVGRGTGQVFGEEGRTFTPKHVANPFEFFDPLYIIC
jgi:hypothetical protein